MSSGRQPPCYFTIDDTLLYNAFHHDFGPLHIGHLYRFAIRFHDILGAKENKDRPVVFWSAADPRSWWLLFFFFFFFCFVPAVPDTPSAHVADVILFFFFFFI